MKSIKVSVIIPVYNTAAYLGECLDSICHQTLIQIEIICVNDGSTDGSLDIIEQYAQKDNRIIVYAQENRGQSAARNKGTAQARGEYIYFMDSDDVLELTALDTLYKRAIKDNLDVLYFNADSFTADPKCEELAEKYTNYYGRKFSYDGIYSGRELLSKMVRNNEYRVSPCLQFINREHYVIHQLDFYEGIIHEDNLFNYKCMLYAGRVGYTPLKLFHRRVRADSTMVKKSSFANVYGYFICHLEMNKFYNGQNLNSEQDDMIFMPVKQMLNSARARYQKLSSGDKQAFMKLPCNQRHLFELYIVDVCKKVDEMEDLKISTQSIKEDADRRFRVSLLREDSLKNSISFRVGRAITWWPRKIRSWFHYFK